MAMLIRMLQFLIVSGLVFGATVQASGQATADRFQSDPDWAAMFVGIDVEALRTQAGVDLGELAAAEPMVYRALRQAELLGIDLAKDVDSLSFMAAAPGDILSRVLFLSGDFDTTRFLTLANATYRSCEADRSTPVCRDPRDATRFAQVVAVFSPDLIILGSENVVPGALEALNDPNVTTIFDSVRNPPALLNFAGRGYHAWMIIRPWPRLIEEMQEDPQLAAVSDLHQLGIGLRLTGQGVDMVFEAEARAGSAENVVGALQRLRSLLRSSLGDLELQSLSSPQVFLARFMPDEYQIDENRVTGMNRIGYRDLGTVLDQSGLLDMVNLMQVGRGMRAGVAGAEDVSAFFETVSVESAPVDYTRTPLSDESLYPMSVQRMRDINRVVQDSREPVLREMLNEQDVDETNCPGC